MTTHEVDVVVVGLGPGGEARRPRWRRAGLSVVGVERRLVGGECPYYGCIPSKMMIRAADALAEARRVPPGRPRRGAARLGPGRDPDPRRGHRRLGRQGRRRAAGGRPGRGSSAATAGWPAPAGCGSATTTYVAARGVVLNTGTEPGVPPIDGLGGHAVLDQPRGDAADRGCREPCSCSAAVRSAASSPRRSPGSGCG